MSIGTTIKKLRRERDMTQEQLADYLGITSRAVSQWECDKTAPDVSLIPLITGIFDVSADVLFGIDNRKKDENIRCFLKEYDVLANKGELKARFDLAKEIYRQYPNDFRVCEKYMYELFYDPNHTEEPFGETVHRDELYRLCDDILDNCTVQRIRYSAMSIVSTLYLNDGMTEKAKEICDQFPGSFFDTASEQYEQLYARTDRDKYIGYMSKNIRECAEHLINKMRNFGTFAARNVDESIFVYEKCLALAELIYDEGDYGFTFYHVGHIHCLLAQSYCEKNDVPDAVRHLDEGLRFCREYDSLPGIVRHTSLLVRDDTEDMSEVYSGSTLTRAEYEINEFTLKYPSFAASEEFSAVICKYSCPEKR